MTPLLRIAFAIATVTLAPVACAGNIVPNPDFSAQLTDWSAPPGFVGTSEVDGSTGAPGAPSARVTGTAITPSAAIATLCLSADALASTTFDFRFATRVDAGTSRGEVDEYSDAACAMPLTGVTTSTARATHEWTYDPAMSGQGFQIDIDPQIQNRPATSRKALT